jgi:hypothetical protein
MRAFGNTYTYEETWLLDESYKMEMSRDEQKETAFVVFIQVPKR